MFDELDIVTLAHDIKDSGLKKGDKGAVVHIYNGGKAVEVEFVTTEGETRALLTLKPSDVSLVIKDETIYKNLPRYFISGSETSNSMETKIANDPKIIANYKVNNKDSISKEFYYSYL